MEKSDSSQSACCCCQKKKLRSSEDKKKLINRLNRIIGQVNGIKNMVENDSYCTDVMLQVSAVRAALNSFNKEILSEHIKTCVTEHVRDGDDEVIDELVLTLEKLMK